MTNQQEFIAHVGIAVNDRRNEGEEGPWVLIIGRPWADKLSEIYEPVPYTVFERLMQIPSIGGIRVSRACAIDFYLEYRSGK